MYWLQYGILSRWERYTSQIISLISRGQNRKQVCSHHRDGWYSFVTNTLHVTMLNAITKAMWPGNREPRKPQLPFVTSREHPYSLSLALGILHSCHTIDYTLPLQDSSLCKAPYDKRHPFPSLASRIPRWRRKQNTLTLGEESSSRVNELLLPSCAAEDESEPQVPCLVFFQRLQKLVRVGRVVVTKRRYCNQKWLRKSKKQVWYLIVLLQYCMHAHDSHLRYTS